MNSEIYKKITEKREFSQLPQKDVELSFKNFDKKHLIDSEKIKLTRDLLRKSYYAFGSQKLLGLKNKKRPSEWFLRKHISTKERLEFYNSLYTRVFGSLSNEMNLNVIDLGCGINYFSFEKMMAFNRRIKYTGVEAVGQLVELGNYYFNEEKYSGRVFHESLFNSKEISAILGNLEGIKIIFLFKVLDSLEMIERDSSKKLLLSIKKNLNESDRIIVSFATSSLIAKRKFFASRKWFEEFARKNFKVIENFELGGERYFVLGK